jgi:hypothetical protein
LPEWTSAVDTAAEPLHLLRLAVRRRREQRLEIGEVLEHRAQRHARALRDARRRRPPLALRQEIQQRVDHRRARRRRAGQTSVDATRTDIPGKLCSCTHSANSIDDDRAKRKAAVRSSRRRLVNRAVLSSVRLESDRDGTKDPVHHHRPAAL